MMDNWKKFADKELAEPTIEISLDWGFRGKNYVGREHWLSHLILENKWTTGAELGVWRGNTFLYLLEKCPDLTLIGIDLWAPQPKNTFMTFSNWPHEIHEKTVRAKSKVFGKRAIIHKMHTVEAAKLIEDKSLDFVFVDADHSSEAVKADFEAWTPKVKDNGWLLGHDINWLTVKKIADDILPGYVIGPDNAWGRKKVI